jgi:2-oxoglutarate dehydrogenase E2 component (dihydrolipoamide succinyltransferase)
MDIKIPELGESITEGTISSWMKAEGDPVKFGDLLLELETDKVNLEINAEGDGILEKINKQAGDTVKVGEVVGFVRGSSEGGNDRANGGARAEAPSEAKAEAKAEGISRSNGAGDTSGNARSSNAVNQNRTAADTINETVQTDKEDTAYTASPSVRRLARERGIDLNQVRSANIVGNDRISRKDIEAIAAGSSSEAAGSRAEPKPTIESAAGKNTANDLKETASDASAKPVERKRMSRRRLTIANRLLEAQRTAAMLTTFNEVDMTAIIDIRKRRKQSFQEKYEVGLGFMSFFTKAVVGALKSFPLLNAEIAGEDIVIKKYYDIGIAVSAKEGLVVPVVREADRLSFAEIEKRIAELAARAGNNSLSLSDLQGGTFTITNGGVFGSLLSTPILNTPQVGILGMHTIQRRPVAIDEDRMENRPMMYIALSYDHRIVDGSEAVRFLVTVKKLLEDPESLLLEG